MSILSGMAEQIFDIGHIEEQEGGLVSTIRIHSDHPLFEGHFPGSPVTPGVVEMMMVRNILRRHFGKKLNMKSLRTCKFLEILDPRITPEIEVNVRFVQKEMLEVTASASFGSNTFFKMQAAYN